MLEAMKMEEPIMAPIDGAGKTVGLSPGDSISGGHLLAVISQDFRPTPVWIVLMHDII